METVTLLIIALTTVGVLLLWLRNATPPHKSAQFPHLPLPPRVSFFALLRYFLLTKITGASLLGALRKNYGDMVHLHIPLWRDVALITTTKHSRQFFTSKSADFAEASKAPIELAAAETIKKTLQYSTPVIAKAFSAARYTFLSKMLKTEVDAYFEAHWNADVQEVDLFAEMQKMTLLIMIKTFLGGDLQGDDLTTFAKNCHDLDLEDRMSHVDRLIKTSILPSGKKQTEAQYQQCVRIVTKVVDKRVKAGGAAVQPDDFLSYLISEYTKDGKPDYAFITMVIFFSVFASATNTYAAASWTLAFVATDNKMKNLVDIEKKEYLAALKEGKDTSLLLMNGTPYTTRLINETVRLCLKGLGPRCLLDDENFGDQYVVPKGWFLIFPFEVITRDPIIYSKPDEFCPDRFLTEAKGACEFVSFGAGRHPCTGVKLAIMEIKILLYSLHEKYVCASTQDVWSVMPKAQPLGVFRPTRPFVVKLTKI